MRISYSLHGGESILFRNSTMAATWIAVLRQHGNFMTTPSPASHHRITAEILELFRKYGASRYGGEAVTQLEHGLQAAHFAEQAGASSSQISAALLHDVGHLLHDLPDDAPDHGIDDCHEDLGFNWLKRTFPASVSEPVKLHVAAKRYLCAAEPDYLALLSQPSLDSLKLQGGPMSETEKVEFESHAYFREAIELRKWDDQAKVIGLQTRPLEHFARYLDQALEGVA